MGDEKNNIMRDAGIVAFGILLAVIMAKTGAVNDILMSASGLRFLGSFIAGLFFVSIFTAVPAAVVLAELAGTGSAFEVALIGSLGALAGDMLILRFVERSLLRDLRYVIKRIRGDTLVSVFHLKLFSWIVPLAGAIILASPLPDEIGIAMM